MNEEIPKCKIIFLGDQGVGKSSILNRFSQDKFEQNYQATIGLDFHSKNVTIENTNIRLLLYDTAGQEKFKSLIPMYIRDANIIIIETFNHTSQWLGECKDLKREDAIFCLVGNKLDMNEKRQVSLAEGEAQAKEKGLIFQEVSAKSGININNLFYKEIFDHIAKKYNLGGKGEEDNTENQEHNNNSNKGKILYFILLVNNVVLDKNMENNEGKKKKKKCC